MHNKKNREWVAKNPMFKGITGRDKDLQRIKSFNQHVLPQRYSPDEPKENKNEPTPTCLSQARTMAIIPLLQCVNDCQKNELWNLYLQWVHKYLKHCNGGNCSNNRLGIVNGIANEIRVLFGGYMNGYFGKLYSDPQRAVYVSLNRKRMKWCTFRSNPKRKTLIRPRKESNKKGKSRSKKVLQKLSLNKVRNNIKRN
ncbi:MAG: hypothetical protein GY941_17375 [Planctomycetes bacterium]|nr:hypothetical protein [Planctomycetota bacterium]